VPNWIPAPGCQFGAQGSACLTGQIDAFVEPGRPPSVPVPPLSGCVQPNRAIGPKGTSHWCPLPLVRSVWRASINALMLEFHHQIGREGADLTNMPPSRSAPAPWNTTRPRLVAPPSLITRKGVRLGSGVVMSAFAHLCPFA
jgi:hypothetical protein